MEHSNWAVHGQPGTAGKSHRGGLKEAPSGLKPAGVDRFVRSGMAVRDFQPPDGLVALSLEDE